MAETPKARPFLKWLGGKTQLLPKLREAVPADFTGYHEPFLGGGALLFDLAARGLLAGKAVRLSDANERLVRTWRGVRDAVEEVIVQLSGYAEEHDAERFYEVRGMDIDGGTDADVAAWMIYLNHTCVNGLYRVNAAGRFNASLGSYENPRICDAENLRAASAVLRGADIQIGDFALCRRARRGEFVYFDPPYIPASRTAAFTSYTAGGFRLADHARLRDEAAELAARGVHVVVSNADTPKARELYAASFRVERVEARRSINSDAEGRGPVGELLIHGVIPARARRAA